MMQTEKRMRTDTEYKVQTDAEETMQADTEYKEQTGTDQKKSGKKHQKTQTEWEVEMSEKILTAVHRELYLDLRFLEPAFSALQFCDNETLHSPATDGRYFYYNTQSVIELFEKNPRYLNRQFLHSVLHCVFRQPFMRGKRDILLWGTACDIAVEYTIDGLDRRSTKRILSFVRQKFYEYLKKQDEGISAAVIYQMLSDLDEGQRQILQQEFFTDDHRFWPKDRDKNSPFLQEVKQNWDKIARQVTMEQKRNGSEESDGAQMFEVLVKEGKSRRSYADFLRKFAVWQEELHCDPDEFDLVFYTYGMQMYHNMPLLEPLETKESCKIREFVIVIDTSYSTSGDLVEGFLEETFRILKEKDSFFGKNQIRIIQCDDQVQKDQKITNEREMDAFFHDFSVAGGGGTDFTAAFAYVDRLRQEGELAHMGGLLYFTDGKGTYPAKKPDYKTAFLFLKEPDTGAVPPWAMRLILKPEELLHEYQTGKRRNQTQRAGISGEE